MGARRSGEHHAIIERARFQDQRFECLQEIRICISMEIKGMSDAIVCDIISQRCLQDRVIMTIVQRRTARQEIQIAAAVAVMRSEEHTSELQSLMRISYADFC